MWRRTHRRKQGSESRYSIILDTEEQSGSSCRNTRAKQGSSVRPDSRSRSMSDIFKDSVLPEMDWHKCLGLLQVIGIGEVRRFDGFDRIQDLFPRRGSTFQHAKTDICKSPGRVEWNSGPHFSKLGARQSSIQPHSRTRRRASAFRHLNSTTLHSRSLYFCDLSLSHCLSEASLTFKRD